MKSAFRSLAAPCLFVSAVAAGLAWVPVPARACSYALRLVEASYPALGDVDVPTDVVLFIYGSELSTSNETRLLDTTTGASVALEKRVAPSGLDLLPLEPLLPHRKYQLVVSRLESSQGAAFGGDDIVEFTTGNAPAAPASAPSAPKVDATVLTYDLGSCGVISLLCLGMAEQPGMTLEVRVENEVLRVTAAPWGMSRAYGGPIAETDCVDVRLRDALGRRSQPTLLCGTDIRRVALENPDFTEGVTCANYSKFIKSAEDGNPDLPPDQVTAPESETLPQPQLVHATDVDYASDSSEVAPHASSSGCALSPISGGSNLAGLGLAVAAFVAVRRRSGR